MRMSARAIKHRGRSEGCESPSPSAQEAAGAAGGLKANTFSFSSLASEDADFEGDGDHLAAEAQLVALQEQLVAVMLENQHLAEELKTLRESSASEQLRQQLEREREKSRILMERLQEKEAKEKERGEREARERERHTRDKSFPPGDKSPSSLPHPPSRSRSPSRGRFAWKRRGLEKSKSLDQSEFLASLNGTTTSSSSTSTVVAAGAGPEASATSCCHLTASWVDDDRRESDSDDGDRGNDSDTGSSPSGGVSGPVVGASVVGSKDPWWRRLEMWVLAAVGELLRDFSEVAEEELPDGDPEGDQLSVKKLKENILRFGSVMRPLTDLSAAVTSLLRWESPSATLLALVIYLYSVIFGWVLPLVLLMAILRLSINYMKKRGWTQNFFRRLRREGGESLEPTTAEAAGLGDKFALVLQVARRVQNQLGAVSNAAEKLKNLLLWEHEATRRLYFFLWLVLLASVLLPAAQLFTLIGVYLGLKFFVLDYIFFRYPRIRLKYDSTSRLWDTLPTDADLERRADKNRADNGNSSPDLTSFLELFSLPATETPLPGWQSGRRCTLVNRDRSLTSAFKNGRLYLTNRLAKQDRQIASSTKLTASTNKVTSSSKQTVPNSPKGNQSAKLPISFTSKQIVDGMRRSSLPGFSRTQNDLITLTSGFSFLSKGSKTPKIKELKEYKEDEVDILEKIFESTDDDEPVTASNVFQTSDTTKGSSPSIRSRDLTLQIWKTRSESDSTSKDLRPKTFGRRRGAMFSSVSEQCELHPAFPVKEDIQEASYTLDTKGILDIKDQTERDNERLKTKKLRLARVKMINADEPKVKISVIDRLNERVFYAL